MNPYKSTPGFRHLILACQVTTVSHQRQRSVLSVIDLSQTSYRTMKQNLWWAAGYNLISVPLAAGILAPISFVLPLSIGPPPLALNAQLLRCLDRTPAASTAKILDRTLT